MTEQGSRTGREANRDPRSGRYRRRRSVAERDAQAATLRGAGLDYRSIARQLGFRSVSSAHDAVARCLKATVREPGEEVRQLELSRLDAALAGIWRRVIGGELGAVDRMLKIMDRRARMLGLDAQPPPAAETRPGEGSSEPTVSLAEILDIDSADEAQAALRVHRGLDVDSD